LEPAITLASRDEAEDSEMFLSRARSAARLMSAIALVGLFVAVVRTWRAESVSVIVKPKPCIFFCTSSIGPCKAVHEWPEFVIAVLSAIWAVSNSSAIWIDSAPIPRARAPPATSDTLPMFEIISPKVWVCLDALAAAFAASSVDLVNGKPQLPRTLLSLDIFDSDFSASLETSFIPPDMESEAIAVETSASAIAAFKPSALPVI